MTVYSPPVSTYTALATTTLSGGETEVTFSSIPQTYADLVLVIDGTASTDTNILAKINGSTADMSTVYMYGSGTAASGNSGGASNVAVLASVGPSHFVSVVNFLNYSATNKHKTFLTRANNLDFNGTGAVLAYCNRWGQNTPINSISGTISGTLSAGTTLSLYGIED